MRLRFAISCLLCLSAITAAADATASSGPSFASSNPPQRGPGGTSLRGGSNANAVTLDIDPVAGQYIVSDSAGVTAGNDCFGVSFQTARCTKYSSPGEYFQATLHGGDDTFEMLSQLRKGLGLKGGEGADKLLAGAGDDEVVGDEGADTLTGRAGSDRLFGDRGRDRLIGGKGKDRLRADNNDPDRAINCGPGDDIVFVDRSEDPKLIGCERIRFR